MVCLTCEYLVDFIVMAHIQGADICNCDALQTICQLCREAPKSEGPKKAATKRKRKTKIRFAELKASLDVSSRPTPLTSSTALPRSGLHQYPLSRPLIPQNVYWCLQVYWHTFRSKAEIFEPSGI